MWYDGLELPRGDLISQDSISVSALPGRVIVRELSLSLSFLRIRADVIGLAGLVVRAEYNITRGLNLRPVGSVLIQTLSLISLSCPPLYNRNSNNYLGAGLLVGAQYPF